jgi:hypothetical protein
MESLAECASGLTRLLGAYDQWTLPLAPAAQIKKIKDEIRYDSLLSDLSSIIADCREGAQRIHDIVLNLRTFSRLDEAGIKKIDIHAGIDATIRLLSQYYQSDRIVLRKAYGVLPLVDCSAGQLNQVWMNLLTNAAQAIGRGPGEVCITTSVDNEAVVVRICCRWCPKRRPTLASSDTRTLNSIAATRVCRRCPRARVYASIPQACSQLRLRLRKARSTYQSVYERKGELVKKASACGSPFSF